MATQESPIPSIVAMLLCEKVITEAGTNKKTLVGIFDRWNPPELPFQVGDFWLYVRLTDAEGKYVFKIRFIYLDEDQVLAEVVTKEVAATDRLSFWDLALPIPILPLPKAGRYEVQLYANDVYVGRCTASVVLRGGK